MFSRAPAGDTRIFFCADIHGSERCFRKWLNAARSYRCDALIFGGDLAGKILQPIVALGAGRHQAEMYGQLLVADSPTELEAITDRIRNAGRYEVIVTPDEKQALDDSPGREAGARRFARTRARDLHPRGAGQRNAVAGAR